MVSNLCKTYRALRGPRGAVLAGRALLPYRVASAGVQRPLFGVTVDKR